MCIIFVANIIWRSGHAIRSSFLLDFSFLHHSYRRDASSQFSASQLCNMVVLAACLGHFLASKSYSFNVQKNGQGELARREGRLFLILNTAINQKVQKIMII